MWVLSMVNLGDITCLGQRLNEEIRRERLSHPRATSFSFLGVSCPLEEAVRASTLHHDSYHATIATEYLPMISSHAPMPPLRLISGPLPSLYQDNKPWNGAHRDQTITITGRSIGIHDFDRIRVGLTSSDPRHHTVIQAGSDPFESSR